MNDALERMRWIEEQIRELANDLDWLDEPVALHDEDENGVPEAPVQGLSDG